jgi:aminoglycoside 6'-N-acetyltransferase I
MQVRIASQEDTAVFAHVAEGVFDNPVDAALLREFLADPRHHMAIAVEDGLLVGMASAVHYVHPDKPAELWINEVGVADAHRGRGIGRQLLETLKTHARSLGCREAWVLTQPDNAAARGLYRTVGGTEAGVVYVTIPLT